MVDLRISSAYHVLKAGRERAMIYGTAVPCITGEPTDRDMGLMMDQHIEWLDEPKDESYDAGLSYLTLVFGNASDIVERFRKATMTRFQAKKVFRASGFSLLVISNSHLRKELNKIAAGKKISPMLLVRREGRKAVIADGYHRMCAVYSLDEDALIPCTIVGAAGGSPQRREGIPIQSVSGVCAAHDTDDADFFGCQEKPV